MRTSLSKELDFKKKPAAKYLQVAYEVFVGGSALVDPMLKTIIHVALEP